MKCSPDQPRGSILETAVAGRRKRHQAPEREVVHDCTKDVLWYRERTASSDFDERCDCIWSLCPPIGRVRANGRSRATGMRTEANAQSICGMVCSRPARQVTAVQLVQGLPEQSAPRTERRKGLLLQTSRDVRLMCLVCFTFALVMPVCSDRCEATADCNIEHSFRINEVHARCKCTLPGAMPMGMRSAMSVDLRRILEPGDRFSLVRSSWNTYVDCSDETVNRFNATKRTSGHMRPFIVPGQLSTEYRMFSNESAVASAHMEVGVYDLCFYDSKAGIWINKLIGLEVQNRLLGLEVMGLRHSDGTRPGVPIDTRHPITIKPILPAGSVASEGDQISIVRSDAKCSDAPSTVSFKNNSRPEASGWLSYSPSTGEFVDSGVLTRLKQNWYHICFSQGVSDNTFEGTGIGIHIQSDVVAVEVNGVMPNYGADVSAPPVRKARIVLHRIVPPLGYHQVVQMSVPKALYSFEDRVDTNMFDNHCGQTCTELDVFTSGFAENAPRGALYQQGAGTYNYFLADGEKTHAYTTANITSSAFAFSVIFVFQWHYNVVLGEVMQIMAPYKLSYDDWGAGSIAVSLRVDPDDSIDSGQRRRLQLTVRDFWDTQRGVEGADELLFNHLFEKEKWYFVAITLDMAGDQQARLYVNGKLETNPTPNKFLEDDKKARVFGRAPNFRMTPAIFAAYHDGSVLKDVFKGYMDEIGLFDRSLSAEEISRQYDVRGVPSSVVPGNGYAALVPPTKTCESAAGFRRDQVMAFKSFIQSRDLMTTVQGDVDATLPQMQPGHYHVCFTRDFPTPTHDLGNWYPTGISFRIQDDMLGLSVNGVQHARGLKSFMPISGSNVIEIFRHSSSPLMQGEAISLIPADAVCAQAPATCSTDHSGHLSTNISVGVMLWGGICNMRPTIYQVCHRRVNGTFRSTGLSLTLQDVVTSASINDIRMGKGHRIAVPKVSTNRIFLATHSTNDTESILYAPNFLPLRGDRRTFSTVYGDAWDTAAIYLSIIPAMADCEDSSENPVAKGAGITIQGQSHMPAEAHDHFWRMGGGESGTVSLRASGHILGNVSLVYDEITQQTYPLGVHLQEDSLWERLSHLHTGSYQICMCVNPKPEIGVSKDEFNVADTDESGTIDKDEMSKVEQRRGQYTGKPDILALFEAVDGDGDGYVSFDEAKQYASSGKDKKFNSTGIGLKLQNEVDAMWVNFLNPNKGIRVNIPRAVGNRIVFTGNRSDFEGFVVSLIHPESDCNLASDNPPECNSSSHSRKYMACRFNGTRVSGFLPLAPNGIVKDTGQFSQLTPGVYQVCVMPRDGVQPSIPAVPDIGATGISVVIQGAISMLQSNGVASGKGNRIALPRVPGNTLTYNVLNASAAHWLSFIQPDQECKLVADSVNVQKLFPKPAWRLRSQGCKNFSVAWHANGTGSEMLLLLEYTRWESGRTGQCAAEDGGRFGMRSRTSDWAAWEHVEYPGSSSTLVDIMVAIDDNGFSLSWGGKVRHTYQHRLPWSRFDRVEVQGSVTATKDGRTSYRQYEIRTDDINHFTSSMPPGIYQVCYAQEGFATTKSFYGERDIAIGTGMSVRVQTMLTGLEVNGIAYIPRRHPQGIVATAPLRQGLVFRAMGNAFNTSLKFNSFNSMNMEYALSFIAPDGDCGSVDAGTGCLDASCDNPRALDPSRRASGLLVANHEDASLRDINGIALLRAAIYQTCLLSPATGEFIATGLSLEIHLRIGGLWVNDADIHDGLHSRASRRNLNTIYVRGRLPTLQKSIEVSGRITLLLATRAASALPWSSMTCARLSKNASPYFSVTERDSIAQESWDAAWGHTGTQWPGLYEVCIQRTNDEPYEATGIAIDMLPAPKGNVASLFVNGVQSWSISAIPFGVPGNEVLFELAGAEYNVNMYFRMVKREYSCSNTATFPPKIPTHNAGLGPRMGRWNQSTVEAIWSRPIGGVFGDSMAFGSGTEDYRMTYKICFSETGEHGIYNDTGLSIYGQRNISRLTLNNKYLHGGRILYLVKIKHERLAFQTPSSVCSVPLTPEGLCLHHSGKCCSFLPRPYQIGDAVSFISVQGNCSNVCDNPIASSGSASGSLFTPKADGVLDYSMQIAGMGPYMYQVCIRGVNEYTWHPTGIRVQVVQNYSLKISGMPVDASRCDVSLPTLTMRMQTPIGILVPYFDSAGRPYAWSSPSRIVIHLYRCSSACGPLQNALQACSFPCPSSEWENVTQYLTGNVASIINGVATFNQLTVHSNAGRFFLQAGWDRNERLTWGDTEEFIVMPNHLVTSGVVSGDQYTVQAVPAASFAPCDMQLISRDDVRCRGNAILPHVSVRLVDSQGITLNMLKEHDGFFVVAELRQGLNGIEDTDHSGVPFPTDLIMAGWLQTGGLRVDDTLISPAPAGLADWSGDYGLQIRRLAGMYFRVHFSVFNDTQFRAFLQVDTGSFGIVPGIYKIYPWSFAVAGNRPLETVPAMAADMRMVELPEIYLELQDASGHPLTHAQCQGCLIMMNDVLEGDVCELMGIRSQDSTCGNPEWTRVAASSCQFVAQNLIGIGEETLDACKKICLGDSTCVAINFTPRSANEGRFTSTCYKVLYECTPQPSQYGDIYIRPKMSDMTEECRCPGEYYDDRTIYHTLYSQQLAVGTQHVAARNISQGSALIRGLYSIFRPGVSVTLSLKMRGIAYTVVSQPLMLAFTPGRQTWDPITPWPGICSCAARPGIMASAESTSRHAAAMEGSCLDLSTLDLMSLMELQAVSCLCTYQNLNLTNCLGCCRPLCWYENVKN